VAPSRRVSVDRPSITSKRIAMLRLLTPLAVAIACLAAVASFASAQNASPAASPVACATPLSGTPAAVASPVASPIADCGLPSFEIDAVDMAFQPAALTVPANTPIRLTLVNKGLALHDFNIDALHVSVILVPGAERTILISFPPGDYGFYCDIPIHPAGAMAGIVRAR
jgi:uncharacterized cupredoxin-like copper-binding protein